MGNIGEPRRRFTVWPKEVPVPVPFEPASAPELEPLQPEAEPIESPEPVEVRS